MKIKYNSKQHILENLQPGSVIPVYMGQERGTEIFITTNYRAGGNILCVNLEKGTTEWLPPNIESSVLDCTIVVNGEPRKGYPQGNKNE